MMMNFKKVAGAGIAAVTLSLMSTSAMATFSGTPTNYATQAIPASGAVTTTTGSIVYTADSAATAGGTFTIVFTLPAGVTFTAAPTITVTGTAASSATLSAGGVGQNTATYNVNVGGAGTPILTFGAVSITGATALSSPKAAAVAPALPTFQITEQITSTSTPGIPIQAAPGTTAAQIGQLATSASALAVTTAGPNTAPLGIDINPTSNGTKFYNGTTANDGIVGDVGAFAFVIPNGTLNATGTAPYAFTSTTVTETYAGATGNVSAAYLNTSNGACPATTAAAVTAGALAGTISGTGIVFSGIPVGQTGTQRELCLYTAGTGVLAANPVGFTVTAAIDSTTLVTTGFNPYTYNGAVFNYPYAVNTSSSYASYIRIVNKSTSGPIVVTASVTSDQGGVGVVSVESSLAANSNDLVPMSTITSNAGLTNTSGRYSITLFAPTGTLAEDLLLNPGGVVTQLQ